MRSLTTSRRLRPLVIAVVTIVILLPTTSLAGSDRSQNPKEFAQQELAKSILSAKLHRICLPDFIDQSGRPLLLGRHVAALLSKFLAEKAKSFTVVSRPEIHKYLAKNGWADHDLTSPGIRAKFTSDFQIDAILWGTISVDHGLMILELSARDPSWTEIFRSHYDQTLDPTFLADLDADQIGISYSFAGVDGVTVPKCLACPIPMFPKELRTNAAVGKVLLSATITTEGTAADVRLGKSVEPLLDRAAIQAVEGWHFAPAHDADGKPVAVRVPIEITFRRY
jgi:TonB family protein